MNCNYLYESHNDYRNKFVFNYKQNTFIELRETARREFYELYEKLFIPYKSRIVII